MASTHVTKEPVVLWMSILAALQAFFAGSAGVSILSSNETLAGIMALGALAVAAAQIGVQFYIRGEVTVNSSVVERRTEDGKIVAGEGNERVKPGVTIRPVDSSTP